MRLGAFLQGAGQHIAAWRCPDQVVDGNTNFEFHKRLARTAERGLFDLYFFADGLAPDFSGGRDGGSSKFAGFEPVTLCAALAPFTTHLGLVATCTTTYEEPFNTARKFASLDLISGGRGGWNVVTSTGDLAAKNFNRDEQPSHASRYRRAHEFVGVVQKLLDSFEDDALIRDRESGYFYDPSKVHRADHVGEEFKVRGPLNVPRSPQGEPVIVQAGQSADGRDLAATVAEAIFTAHQQLESAQEFYRDVKSRAAAHGRDPNHVLIMPGLAPYVGRTEEEARSKYERLNALILEEDGLMFLSQILGSSVDLRNYDLDGPLPPITVNEGTKSRQELLIKTAKENNFTIRQLYQWIATARGHLTVIGTPEKIVDVMQDWFENAGADGFNILPAWVPGGLDDFVDLVIPELQRRGLFRTEYEGKTLRENLGLPRPANRWAAARQDA
jgi:FMN-dependent oxidoreductase (nitrilotriacetate monooxygenase family)